VSTRISKADNRINTIINLILPVMVMGVTFAVYTLVEKKELTAAIVFSSMTVFELIKGQMMMVCLIIVRADVVLLSIERNDPGIRLAESYRRLFEAGTCC
jgi:uncharacterized MnhB-related membrane protein